MDGNSRQRPVLCEAAVALPVILLILMKKYVLGYYVELAKRGGEMGAHILAIKDMAGLCHPMAASKLVKTLRKVGIPVHFHTHDSSGISYYSIIKAVEAGVDVGLGHLFRFQSTQSQFNRARFEMHLARQVLMLTH